MEGNKITVNVRIGNVTLPMTVSNTEEEEVVRNAASLVQSKLNYVYFFLVLVTNT